MTATFFVAHCPYSPHSMISGLRHNFLFSTPLLAVVGWLLMSSMVWTVLTEPPLSGVFWPADIHATVVAAFGGSLTTSLSGQIETSLDWTSVALGLAGTLVVAAAIAGITQAAGKVPPDATSPTNRTATVAAQSGLSAVSVPWLFAGIWLTAWLSVTMLLNPALMSFLVTTTPLWTALIVAASLSRFVGALVTFRADSDAASIPMAKSRCECIIVVFAAVAWVAVSFWINERLYAGLLVPHGDSAMYEEHLWNVWHGKGFRSYLDQGLFLGEHIQVIHLLLLPLHMLWPSYLMLELAASASLAMCVIPIYSIARRHTGSNRAAMWLALAWLLFFPMHFLDIAIDLKTLRPSCYGLPFLFWGIDFAERRRLVRASLCLLLALTTQEDFALVVGSIGAVLWLTDRGRMVTAPDCRRFSIWSLSVLLFAVVYVLVAVLVVIPYFRGGAVVHYSRYFGNLGNNPSDLLRTTFTDPLKVLSVLFSLRTLYYVLVLTVPLGLSPWRRPVFLLAGVATFGMLSLIQLGNGPGVDPDPDSDQATSLSELPPIPYHHFHAPLLPVIFWAAAAGLRPRQPSASGACQPSEDHRSHPRPDSCSAQAPEKSLPNHRRPGSIITLALRVWVDFPGTSADRARFVFFCALATAVTGSMMPVGVNFWSAGSSVGWSRLSQPSRRAAAFEKVLAQLPISARVASTDYVHTRLTHFERSYDYSDYLRAVNNYQPGVPADTDYIVIDTSHPYSRVRTLAEVRELQTEPDKWDVLPDETNGLFIVLKRRHSL